MPTLHIEAEKNDIVSRVLMPEDPNLVYYIASKYLTDAHLVNKLRGEIAYTGKYKGIDVTIFSSGIGISSIGIYSYELFNNYDVDRIIRIGNASSYTENLKVNDLFLVDSVYSLTTFDTESGRENIEIINSSTELNGIITSTALINELDIKVGRVHTAEAYYSDEEDYKRYTEIGCQAVDMETYALLYNAKRFMKKATSLLTITDSLVTHESINEEASNKKKEEMIILALESIIKN